MPEKPTIWKREFHLGPLLRPLPENLAEWLALVCAALFILSPLPVGILCLIHRSIDYTVYTHPRFFNGWIWPFSALSGILALVLAWGKGYRQGRRPRLRREPVRLAYLLLVLWMLIATTVNGWNRLILNGSIQFIDFESIFMQLGYFLVLFPASTLIRDRRKKRWLIRGHELASLFLVPTAFILWKTQTFSALIPWTPSLTGIYGNTNYYGYYLAVSIPLAGAMFVQEKGPGWKVLSLLTLGANTVTLCYNNTMGAWVACTAALLFLLIAQGILEKRLDPQALLVILVFALCLWLPGHLRRNFQNNVTTLASDLVKIVTHSEGYERAGSGRWRIWQRGLVLIGEHPLFGIGFEGIEVLKLWVFARNINRIHNEFLQYALFYGIPAGVFYFLGCLGVFLRALKKRAGLDGPTLVCLTAAFGYLVSSFFGLTLFCTAPFLFLFLGMGYAQEEPGPERLRSSTAERDGE